jgi:hypothetical protein
MLHARRSDRHRARVELASFRAGRDLEAPGELYEPSPENLAARRKASAAGNLMRARHTGDADFIAAWEREYEESNTGLVLADFVAQLVASLMSPRVWFAFLLLAFVVIGVALLVRSV